MGDFEDGLAASDAHILAATARLRAKYNAKLVNARRDDPDGADVAERCIVAIENEHAAYRGLRCDAASA